MTQSKNGWGPAAPATNADTATVEPDTGAYEEIEESTNEEAATESRRRVYTGSEEASHEEGTEQEGTEQEGTEQTYDTGPEDIEVGEEDADTGSGEEISGEEDEDSVPAGDSEDIEEFGPETKTEEEPGFTRDDQASKCVPPEPEPAPTGQANSRATARSDQGAEQSIEDLQERAFDPDADSRTADRMRRGGTFHDAPNGKYPNNSDDDPAGEPATYGAYGASRLRRSVAASLRELPAVGKLFRPRSQPSQTGRADPERVRKEPFKEDRAGRHGPTGALVADEQAIAAKPSPQEVQRRLTLALRETSIDGYAKLAVGSPKGGVGKSSLAYAIGCAIADGTNIRVCLVDADPEFGATRSLVPRPVQSSVVELARDADSLQRLSDIRSYVAQNERMRLDVVLNPPEMVQKTRMGDLPTAYERIDAALSRFYDLVIYDMGIGFSHPQIQKVLSLSDELLLVGDSEVVPNDIFADALSYVQGLEFGLDDTTLAISHRLPPTDESATTGLVKSEHAKSLRRVTEIPYDAAFSQLLNRRAFSMDALSLETRLGVLTTAASCLEGLRGPAKNPKARKGA